jgi:hypothetical protein
MLVSEATRGCTACSSPVRASRSGRSPGRSLPSIVGTVSTLMPAIRSGAPASSTCACEVAGVMTASQRRHSAPRTSTFAAVPLKTGHGWALAPKCARSSSSARAVNGSAP